jgi:hypothetical protein
MTQVLLIGRVAFPQRRLFGLSPGANTTLSYSWSIGCPWRSPELLRPDTTRYCQLLAVIVLTSVAGRTCMLADVNSLRLLWNAVQRRPLRKTRCSGRTLSHTRFRCISTVSATDANPRLTKSLPGRSQCQATMRLWGWRSPNMLRQEKLHVHWLQFMYARPLAQLKDYIDASATQRNATTSVEVCEIWCMTYP